MKNLISKYKVSILAGIIVNLLFNPNVWTVISICFTYLASVCQNVANIL